jgi:hypothetical protein
MKSEILVLAYAKALAEVASRLASRHLLPT